MIRSDVPVGICVSGGLDSSAIAAWLPESIRARMQRLQRRLSRRPRKRRTPATHSALADNISACRFTTIELLTSEMVSFFPELVYLRDDPIADIAGFRLLLGNETRARTQRSRLLQGQGGDELFWGYDWVRDAVRESARKGLLLRQGVLATISDYLKLELPHELSRLAIGEWVHKMGGLRPGWQSLQRDRRTPPAQLVFYDIEATFAV